MNQTKEYVSCTKLLAYVEQGSQQQFYALVLTHPLQRTLDIDLTDGQHAWRGTGLKASTPPGLTEDEAWNKVRQLLTGVGPETQSAALSVTELPSGGLQLAWRWDREVGAGRHIMKLPVPAVVTTAQWDDQQQCSGVLMPQQPPHSTITRILDTLVTSCSALQASMAVSSAAQSSLQSSLDLLQGQLHKQAAEYKERERELYLKFTMLLNTKTSQLQKEHLLAQHLSKELQQLKGAAEVDTDDENTGAAYADDEAGVGVLQHPSGLSGIDEDVETEPVSDDEDTAGQGQKEHTGGGSAGGSATAGLRGAINSDTDKLDSKVLGDGAALDRSGAGSGPGGVDSAAGCGYDGGGGVVADDMQIDLTAETQLLPDSVLAVYQQHTDLQQQQK